MNKVRDDKLRMRVRDTGMLELKMNKMNNIYKNGDQTLRGRKSTQEDQPVHGPFVTRLPLSLSLSPYRFLSLSPSRKKRRLAMRRTLPPFPKDPRPHDHVVRLVRPFRTRYALMRAVRFWIEMSGTHSCVSWAALPFWNAVMAACSLLGQSAVMPLTSTLLALRAGGLGAAGTAAGVTGAGFGAVFPPCAAAEALKGGFEADWPSDGDPLPVVAPLPPAPGGSEEEDEGAGKG